MFLQGRPADDLKQKRCVFSLSLKPIKNEQDIRIVIQKTLSAFGYCDISLCDTAHRYNLMWQDKCSLEEAYARTWESGKEWVQGFYSLFSPEERAAISLVRWDSWLQHPDFEKKRLFTTRFYEEDSGFREAIKRSVERYLNRCKLKGMIFDFTEAHRLSTLLVAEEVAVLLLLSTLAYDFEVFLERRSPGLQYFYDKVIRKEHQQVLQPVLIKINL